MQSNYNTLTSLRELYKATKKLQATDSVMKDFFTTIGGLILQASLLSKNNPIQQNFLEKHLKVEVAAILERLNILIKEENKKQPLIGLCNKIQNKPIVEAGFIPSHNILTTGFTEAFKEFNKIELIRIFIALENKQYYKKIAYCYLEALVSDKSLIEIVQNFETIYKEMVQHWEEKSHEYWFADQSKKQIERRIDYDPSGISNEELKQINFTNLINQENISDSLIKRYIQQANNIAYQSVAIEKSSIKPVFNALNKCLQNFKIAAVIQTSNTTAASQNWTAAIQQEKTSSEKQI